MPKMKTHSGAKKRFRVTANGKLRRDAINKRFQPQIEEMFSATPAA